MFNPYHPLYKKNVLTYSIPEKPDRTIARNTLFNTGPESRLGKSYTRITWRKLAAIGVSSDQLNGASILECCAGTGYVAYHLLKNTRPRKYLINEVSPAEIDQAKTLLTQSRSSSVVEFTCCDIAKLPVIEKYDFVIGNSFLHHIADVPQFLVQVRRLLAPAGTFVMLHEPTPTAIGAESGNPLKLLLSIFAPERYHNFLHLKATRNRHYDEADIWLFEPKHLSIMLKAVGFEDTIISYHGLLETVFGAWYHKLRLKRPHAYEVIRYYLFKLDCKLALILPHSLFSSIAIRVSQPKKELDHAVL